MSRKDDSIYSENNLYNMACRLGSGLRENKDDERYLFGPCAEEMYTVNNPDIRVKLMVKAWKYAILLKETEDMPEVVKDAIKEKVKAFVDSYNTLFTEKKGDE